MADKLYSAVTKKITSIDSLSTLNDAVKESAAFTTARNVENEKNIVVENSTSNGVKTAINGEIEIGDLTNRWKRKNKK